MIEQLTWHDIEDWYCVNTTGDATRCTPTPSRSE